MNRPPLKVLCITGWCRNGSTIIGNILGEIPGFFHVGELHYLWLNSSGKGSNKVCGCGTELTSCPVWSRILPLGRPTGVSAEDYAAVVTGRQQACVRTRHTWRVLRRGLSGTQIRAHAALMSQVYHAIAEQTETRVIVDTTKIPGEAALLPHLEGITPYYVHLVRDPRAVAQSWSRQKQYAYVMPSWKSTAYWHGFNLAARAVTRRHPDRSLLLRYEDFIADPVAAIDSVLRQCDADPSENPFLRVPGGRGAVPPGLTSEVCEEGRRRLKAPRHRGAPGGRPPGQILLHANHTVTGNPDRFRAGLTVIRDRDVSWDGLPASSKLAAVALSWPAFRRYGYRYGGTFRAGPPQAAAEAQSAEDQISRR
jgi:hypothetical protein